MSAGRVTHLYRSEGHRAPLAPQEALRLVAGVGAEGEPKSRRGGRRQLLAADAETLREERLGPADLRAQLVLEGVLVDRLPEGTLLRIGGAVVEVAQPCTPCRRMDELRPGLQAALWGRRGRFLRVVRDGEVRVGDAVRPVPSADQTMLDV